MKKIFLILFLCAWGISLSAQSPETAEQQFDNADYATALTSYESLLKSNPKSPLYLYRYARCSQQMGDYATAIEYFIKAGDKYPLKHFFIAECYFRIQQMENAIDEYKTYLAKKPDDDRKDYILNQIQSAEKISRYQKRSTTVTFLDTMCVPRQALLHCYDISPEAGMLFRRDSVLFGYMNQLGRYRIFADGSDSASCLLAQYHLLDSWSTADTLPSIVNIGTRQNTPYLLSDGVTLYYASDLSDGLGGLDIYITRHNTATDTYTRPENIGLPFNSPGNDFLYVLDETRGVGYWATDFQCPADSVFVYKFQSGEPLLWSTQK